MWVVPMLMATQFAITNSEFRAVGGRFDSLVYLMNGRSTMTTKWRSGGQDREYTTVAKAGETPKQHAERHRAELAEVQSVFPPDPQ